MLTEQDSRFPWTYAADYLRQHVGDDYGKGLISRAAASAIHHEIAKLIGMDEREMACTLARVFIALENCKEDVRQAEGEPATPPGVLGGSPAWG